MRVWVLITPGLYGDMEVFSGVFTTAEAAKNHYDKNWRVVGDGVGEWEWFNSPSSGFWGCWDRSTYGKGAWVQEETVRE